FFRLRKVPLVEPRSSSTTPLGVRNNRQCRPETPLPSRQRSFSAARPTVTSSFSKVTSLGTPPCSRIEMRIMLALTRFYRRERSRSSGVTPHEAFVRRPRGPCSPTPPRGPSSPVPGKSPLRRAAAAKTRFDAVFDTTSAHEVRHLANDARIVGPLHRFLDPHTLHRDALRLGSGHRARRYRVCETHRLHPDRARRGPGQGRRGSIAGLRQQDHGRPVS